MSRRPCIALNARGLPCGAAARRDRPYCAMHDPEAADAVAEARRVGGVRRRREGTLHAALDLDDVRSREGLWRVLEVAILDTLALDNGIARNRTLVHAVREGRELLADDLEARVAALELAMADRTVVIAGSLLETEGHHADA